MDYDIEFHLPNSDHSLILSIKPKAKFGFSAFAVLLFYIL
jgi:hypothetical protein